MSRSRLYVLLATVLALVGFKIVTQSGLEGAKGWVQNDGYASVGGIVIFLAGIFFGLWLSRRHQGHDK